MFGKSPFKLIYQIWGKSFLGFPNVSPTQNVAILSVPPRHIDGFQNHRNKNKIHPSLRRPPHPQLQPAYRIGITPRSTFQKTETRPSQIVQIPKHPICLMSYVSSHIDVKQFNAIGGAATSLHVNTSMFSFGSYRFETPCVPHCTAKKTKQKKNIKPPNHSKTCMSSMFLTMDNPVTKSILFLA